MLKEMLETPFFFFTGLRIKGMFSCYIRCSKEFPRN